jgi:uncharacterized membrane protein (DUF106 family)
LEKKKELSLLNEELKKELSTLKKREETCIRENEANLEKLNEQEQEISK